MVVLQAFIKTAAVSGIALFWVNFTVESLKLAWHIISASLEPIVKHQAAMAKYTRERTQLLDWIETNREIKAQADQNFTNTDYAFKLYNQAHPDYKLSMPTAPKFSDMYQPRELQKQGELLFVGGGALALAAFLFL